MKKKILALLTILIFISANAFALGEAEKLYEKADKHYLQGNYSEALAYCRRMLIEHKMSGFRDDVRYLAGLSLLKLGRYNEARSYFGSVITRRPTSSLREDAYLGFADSYFLEKNYAKARETYGEIVTRFPDTNHVETIQSRFKQMKKKTAKKKPEKKKSAKKKSAKALKTSPGGFHTVLFLLPRL